MNLTLLENLTIAKVLLNLFSLIIEIWFISMRSK